MPKVALPLPELSDQQKALIATNWRMDLRQLVQMVFSDPTVTLREVKAKAVKKHLAELGYSANTELVVIPPRELSTDETQYVENNHESSSPLELVRTVFKDQSLTLNSPEGKAVLILLKRIAPERYNRNDEPVEDMEYKPPQNLKQMIARVNKLVPNPAGIATPLYNPAEMNAQIQKNLNVLLACVNIPRFIHQASQYLKKVDRELFESSFLRQIHDNTDLTAQDIDQYIAYCASIVSSAQTDRTIQRLQAQVDDSFEMSQKVSMPEVEHLKALNTSLQAEKLRQQNLYKTLNGERSKRLNDMTQASISMHPLVQAWRTKQGRDRLLKGAAVKRDALGKEVARLTEMEMIRAEIWGLAPDSILK